MAAYLEHANITVPDVDAAIQFLRALDDSIQVRHDETPEGSHRWVHVGTDTSYIALQAPHVDVEPKDARPTYENHGVNHLGWVVDDLDAVVRRLDEMGYEQAMLGAPHRQRKRVYYYDAAGFEWEIVEYLADDPQKRNDYNDEG